MKVALKVGVSREPLIELGHSPNELSVIEVANGTRSFHSRRHLFGTFGKQIRHVADLVEKRREVLKHLCGAGLAHEEMRDVWRRSERLYG